jgi:hypothetical protein
MSIPLLQLVQARFLRELFRSSKGGFVLKGGMAIGALFGNSRQTRDIDLDFPPEGERSAQSLHNQIKRALEQALRGYVTDVRINSPGKAEVSPKWKVSGKTSDGAPFNLKVEVSRRPPPPGTVRQVTVSGIASLGLGLFYVDLYSEPTLTAMKIAALLSPDRCAPRDVYDLDLLLPAHEPGPELLAWALEVAQVSLVDAPRVLQEKLVAMPWELFQTQTLPALDPSLASRYTPAVWAEVKGRVTNSLSELFAKQPHEHEVSA